jgi:hypothetical protein
MEERLMTEEKEKYFLEYMRKFENRVMLPCIADGIFKQKVMVSTKKPKLLKTSFGKFVGSIFEHDEIVAFNYYGLMKVSLAFINEYQHYRNLGLELKAIQCPVVYFGALKMQHITKYGSGLFNDFVAFKEYLVDLRWNHDHKGPPKLQ